MKPKVVSTILVLFLVCFLCSHKFRRDGTNGRRRLHSGDSNRTQPEL